jgi:hypothetical protein
VCIEALKGRRIKFDDEPMAIEVDAFERDFADPQEGWPLPRGLRDSSSAQIRLIVRRNFCPRANPRTSARTFVTATSASCATCPSVNARNCSRFSNNPSALVRGLDMKHRIRGRRPDAERPPTTERELAPCDSMTMSSARMMCPPNAAAFPRKMKRRRLSKAERPTAVNGIPP